jgi:uroporphyrinogen decarboxylase
MEVQEITRNTCHSEGARKMTPKQRVLDAINHKRTDRVPLDLWVTKEVMSKLCAHFQTDEADTVMKELGADIRLVEPQYVGPPLEESPAGMTKDIWGVTRRRVEYSDGSYLETEDYPLDGDISITDIEGYTWPDPDHYDYSVIPRSCEKYGDYAILNVGNRLNRTSVLKAAMYLRGMQQLMMDMALNPPLVEALLEKISDYYLAHNERIFKAGEGLIDIFMMGDDFGTQKGLLISAEMFRRYFAPKLKEFAAQAKSYGMKVMLHSCGSVRELIPDIIEIGVDILNPVQTNAKNMIPEELKAEFGDRICFHGGLDIQHTLPFGTPEDVENEVKDRIRVLGENGGYILASTHNIQTDTPVENILTMYETAQNERMV